MYFPTFSPQGNKILFFATVDGGDIQIFTIPTDGGTEATQVTRGKGERNVFPRWSTDGSFFYSYQLRPTLSFRQISASGTSSDIVSGWRWRTHNSARVSPDGKRIIFTRHEKPKVTSIIRDLETKTEKVFEPTLGDPQWSKDGKSLLGFMINPATYWSNPSGDIVVCPVDDGMCRKVASNGTGPVWSGDESRIYFGRMTSLYTMEMWSVTANGEDEQRIVELQHMDKDSNFADVSSTGQVVYVQLKPGKHELWMTDLK
jgi:Tol biopolymer transport system component